MQRVIGVMVASFLIGAVIAIGCGSSEDSEFGSSGASGGTSGASGNSSSGFGSSGLGGDGSSGGGEGGNCSAPVDMYIMFDRSGSMGNDCNIGGAASTKWCRAINALSGYFKSSGATGQAAALQFFPQRTDTYPSSFCATGDGLQVAALPKADYTTLPSNSFDAILNAEDPTAGPMGTPTEAAIRGIARFTAANRRPARVTIGVLITDGDPNGCNQNLTALSDLLAAHNSATTIRTYVIGMQGADFANIEKIALGGGAPPHPDAVPGINDACGNGAGPCRHWNVGDGDPAAFTAALAAIQESADGCKPGGGTVNPPK